jgi:hypothetical protein
MARIILIHGALQGLKSNSDKRGGYLAYKTMLDSKEAVIYWWAIEKAFSHLQWMNPFQYITVYQKEKQLVRSPQQVNLIADYIQNQQPEMLIAHSRGTELVTHYLNTHLLPTSVKRIIFLFGGVSRNSLSINNQLQKRIKNQDLKIINYYCPWDTVLLFTSTFINRCIPAGLFGIDNKFVKNKFYPLYIGINIHMAILKDEDFMMKLLL